MPKKEATGKSKYIFAVGRRKTAKARVKLFVGGSGMITVNGRQFENYFPTLQLQKDATDALNTSGLLKKVDVEASTNGGGVNAQAKAIRLGIARALVVLDPAFKTVLKKEGYMTRDARKKERKKPGLKRARRAPQWQKR
ncbi:MAG: 30S ribosomal protein S9 [bacterium]|nr:30S ribosomal protein S9 [bacterium]